MRWGDADLARRVVLGYVSYALNRVGEVAESTADIDTIMSMASTGRRLRCWSICWAPQTPWNCCKSLS